MSSDSPITDFIDRHYQHFNAATLKDASQAYCDLLDQGGKMFVTLAGAMSTAELGKSFAEMIRQDKVHGICCTGANLEEDVFNLVAHDSYHRIPGYRYLTAEDEEDLLNRKLRRVTDTCIPEDEAMVRIEKPMIELWKRADQAGESKLPHEFFYELLRTADLNYEIPAEDSWLIAAAEKNLPLFVPGWEDSTLGNGFAARCIDGTISNSSTVRSGIEVMRELVDFYRRTTAESPLGFYQIGGGIAGDFPICVVPLIHLDLEETDVPVWSYFCQISDSTTSYGSYSGAVPNEKITWDKLRADTPSFVIESDATIVAPLMFAYILGW
ncbi:MAG: deoxyhypusine synthase [Verrucomicrobiales bacterium]|nr:deoxyhypusine synthase [Verrucomicrobiales bacterium]